MEEEELTRFQIRNILHNVLKKCPIAYKYRAKPSLYSRVSSKILKNYCEVTIFLDVVIEDKIINDFKKFLYNNVDELSQYFEIVNTEIYQDKNRNDNYGWINFRFRIKTDDTKIFALEEKEDKTIIEKQNLLKLQKQQEILKLNKKILSNNVRISKNETTNKKLKKENKLINKEIENIEKEILQIGIK